MRALAKTALLTGLACFAALQAGAAGVAELKLHVRLDAGVIRVADLWADAGPKADTVIGSAPPPGRGIAIEAAQLAYIAHLYDVNWHPVSGVERTMLERAGRPLSHDEMTLPLKRGLIAAGAAENVSVELPNTPPVLVPPLSYPLLSVEGMHYDLATGRFAADLSVAADGMETQRMRVEGRAVEMVTAVIASRRLSPGEVIGADDVRVVQVPAQRLAAPPIGDIVEAVGLTPKRAVVAGQPLSAGELGAPVMIPKGSTVVMALETPNMSLAAQGLALTAGGKDDEIQVMNPLSRAVVTAKVTGPGRAVVLSNSTPLKPPSRSVPRGPEVSN